MHRRVLSDRAGLRRGDMNFHYEHMGRDLASLRIPASSLHFDDGVSELDPEPVFDWRRIYGRPPEPEGAGQSR
jgi:hypothetical protein